MDYPEKLFSYTVGRTPRFFINNWGLVVEKQLICKVLWSGVCLTILETWIFMVEKNLIVLITATGLLGE